MLKKLSNILKYYDSEPMEILMGLIWFIIFPVTGFFEFKFQPTLLIISMVLGYVLIKSTCIGKLDTRKPLAYGSFLFSMFILIIMFLDKEIQLFSNWFWWLPLIISIMNLTNITSQYYKKQRPTCYESIIEKYKIENKNKNNGTI